MILGYIKLYKFIGFCCESAFKVVYSQQRVEDSVVVEDWI